MSDFLLRLAQQALGSEPGLQPVLRPRYAPAPAAVEPDDARSGAPGAAVEHQAGRGRLPPPPRVPSPANLPPPARRDGGSSAPLAAEPLEPLPSAPRRQTRTPGPEAPSTVEGPLAAERFPAPAPRDEARRGVVPTSRSLDVPLLPAPAEAARARLPTVPPADRPAPREAVERAGSEGPAPATAVTGSRGAGQGRTEPVEPAALRHREAGREAPHAPAVEDRVAARTSGAPADPVAAADAATLLLPVRAAPPATRGGDHGAEGGGRPPAPAAEPPVRVTIGRIEVRAETPERPSGPAPAPEWRPPVLSLDEYLRGTGRT